MKRKHAAAIAPLVMICAAALGAPVIAHAQSSTSQQPSAQTSPSTSTSLQNGSVPAEALKVPDRSVWLGTVRLPVRVMADGQPLTSGTYRVRLTGEHAKNDALGQTERLERWVEFVQSGKVKGRAMAPVVPSASAKQVAKRPLPSRGSVRAERMKEDQYYRLWFNYQGDQVLVYLPIA